MKARTRLIALAVGALLVAAFMIFGTKIDEWTGTTKAERCADLQVGVTFYDALLASREAAYEADPDAEMPALTEAELASRAVAQALLDSCKAGTVAEEAVEDVSDAAEDAAEAVEDALGTFTDELPSR